ncbi:glycosyltransferase family 4 protein [Paenibacillus sp. GCM10027628]|uniref:glycosyltransferase family 4 protein n=1 Tax=Paenibacillus sp. GCM10027628 TaxID=3273413 RepID=UPI00363F0B4E
MNKAANSVKTTQPLKSSHKRKQAIRKAIIRSKVKQRRLLKLKRALLSRRKKIKQSLSLKKLRLRKRRKHIAQETPVGTQEAVGTTEEAPEPAEPGEAQEPVAALPAVDLKPGVNLIGYIRTEIGLGEGCRLMAKSLEAAEVPFGIMNFTDPGANSARNNDRTWIHKESEKASFKVNFFHMNANNLRAAYDNPVPPLVRDVFQHRFNIGYWAWELPEFPDEWCNSFELVQEVWAPSQFIVDSVKPKSPHPVVRIPHAVHVQRANSFDRRAFGLPNDQFLFLSMYDTHSLKERKNPQAVIKAFKQAFRSSDSSVGLVIKVNNPNSKPEDMEWLKQQTEGYSNIYMIHQIMDRDKVNALINATDCFVSLHRSEGFGLVMAEAMFLGKPVIGTNWSGNTDYMHEGNACPVKYNLIPVGQDVGPYKAHQIWADPDIEHAAYYMRRLVQDSVWRKSIASNGKQTIHTEYSPLVIGQKVKNRLVELGLL